MGKKKISLTHIRDTSVSVKETTETYLGHNNTEVDTVCKQKKYLNELNVLPGKKPNADAVNTEVDENNYGAQTNTHDALVCIQDTTIKKFEHKNSEPETVCKHKKGEIEVNLEPETTQTADLGLTEGNVNTKNTQTHAHNSSVFVKEKIFKNPEENTEHNSIHKHSEGEIEVNILLRSRSKM